MTDTPVKGRILEEQKSPSTPLQRYFSRRSTTLKHIPEVPAPDDFVGMYSVWGVVWGLLFLTVPLSYCYIALVLLRELCRSYPVLLEDYLPSLVKKLVLFMDMKSSRTIEYCCHMEAVFYIMMKLKIKWLQLKDPLEASLSAAPLLELEERKLLWRRMMECETDDPAGFLTGWFFDCDIEKITKYDVRDFCAWSMFEGRHQEHLTTKELRQLEDFVEEAEHRISLQLYGEADEGVVSRHPPGSLHNEREADCVSISQMTHSKGAMKGLNSSIAHVGNGNVVAWKASLPKPKKMFRFADEPQQQEHSFFSNLYESYRNHYDSMMSGVNDFHPVQDLRDRLGELISETAQQISHAEETAKATASQMFEHLVPSGSQIDKRLTAMSNATYAQLNEAWNSVKNMKERLETARFLSQQRARIRQQLKGYRVMLNRMREMSSAVPSAQMAAMMRRITECNVALESLESRAQAAFVHATGFAKKKLPAFLTHPRHEPRHFARYSSDPLLGIATYPLGFHLLILTCTEVPLRILMNKRGFERKTIGPVSYYFHPGREFLVGVSADDALDENDETQANVRTPIIFVHGIGIGLIVYIPLIDKLLATGRPILLPEIPYVSGFRPWLSPLAVLPPGSVVSTMTSMLASHGFMNGTWVGHSYGTSWLSYMVKFASHAVASVLFLDPICFSLHVPRLTKQFVYSKPDPGSVSYIVRTDIIVNWTIQRSFPWAWIILFLEQIRDIPCGVFLSDKDALVPVDKVEAYFRRRGVPIRDFEGQAVDYSTHFDEPFNCTVFRGHGHGDWTESPSSTVCTIGKAVEALCRQAESKDHSADDEASTSISATLSYNNS